MQLDVFVPRYSLAFEYQGQQHYDEVRLLGPREIYQQRDEEKRKACREKEITLVEIPFWWDLQVASLQATLHKARPDIVQAGNGTPIPVSCPEK